ncbi:MAG TPA: CPBP family intramembrane metalloprotease [Bacillota bacterium]|nr:CPBP family intramembrane metalloprotease [Bacillota bacterium]HOL08842.1 CPBP family intramembrane metalloprotease [Bacillota bacterium]HPO96535.1 CPBP family intramembrane metalloprotease [Bacillota bacterium]
MSNDIKQPNMLQLVLMHLFPGLPILLVALVLSNPYWGPGLPFMVSIHLAIAFGLIPTELLILFVMARQNGRKIKEMIFYTNKISVFNTLLWVIPLFTILGIAFSTVPEIEKPLWTMFDWVPDWFRINVDIIKQQPSLVWPTVALALTLNGLLGPIVEEIYFRGFLLPRMNKLGKLAPLINVVLFSLYHFFTPWENITRILGTLPYVYTVWHKQNLQIGIIVHCLGNFTGIILTAIFLLS